MLINLNSQLDGRYRGQTDIQQRCVDAKVLCTDFLGDNLVQLTLQIVLWLLKVVCRQPWSTANWLRQPFAVHLAIVVARYLVYLHHHLGHHVLGLLGCHMLLDGLSVEFTITRDVGHDIGTV